MERHRAADLLPTTYARALRLREAGVTDAEIAERLSVPLQAVGLLLRVGEAKLARILERFDVEEMR